MMHFVRFAVSVAVLVFLFAWTCVVQYRGQEYLSDWALGLVAIGTELGIGVLAYFAVRWWWVGLPAQDRAGWAIAFGVVVFLTIARGVGAAIRELQK